MELLRAVPILTVTDVDAAVQEYSELLGLDVLMNLGGWRLWGRAAVPSSASSTSTSPRRAIPRCRLRPDVDVANQRARDSGVEIVHPLMDEDWGVRRFFLRTSSGHVVNVLSHHG